MRDIKTVAKTQPFRVYLLGKFYLGVVVVVVVVVEEAEVMMIMINGTAMF